MLPELRCGEIPPISPEERDLALEWVAMARDLGGPPPTLKWGFGHGPDALFVQIPDYSQESPRSNMAWGSLRRAAKEDFEGSLWSFAEWGNVDLLREVIGFDKEGRGNELKLVNLPLCSFIDYGHWSFVDDSFWPWDNYAFVARCVKDSDKRTLADHILGNEPMMMLADAQPFREQDDPQTPGLVTQFIHLPSLRDAAPDLCSHRLCNQISAYVRATTHIKIQCGEIDWDERATRDSLVYRCVLNVVLRQMAARLDEIKKNRTVRLFILGREQRPGFDEDGNLVLLWNGWESEPIVIPPSVYKNMKSDQEMRGVAQFIESLIDDKVTVADGSEGLTPGPQGESQRRGNRGKYKQYAFKGKTPPPREVIEGAVDLWGDEALDVLGVPRNTWDDWNTKIDAGDFHPGFKLSTWVALNSDNVRLRQLIDWLRSHYPID